MSEISANLIREIQPEKSCGDCADHVFLQTDGADRQNSLANIFKQLAASFSERHLSQVRAAKGISG